MMEAAFELMLTIMIRVKTKIRTQTKIGIGIETRTTTLSILEALIGGILLQERVGHHETFTWPQVRIIPHRLRPLGQALRDPACHQTSSTNEEEAERVPS
jgi:hypothetical protein